MTDSSSSSSPSRTEVGGEPRWPNLIVAGTQKSGTTWLHIGLNRHPQVFMSEPKELFYWGRPGWDESDARDAYRDHFSFAEDHDLRWWGESSTNYLWRRDEASPYSKRLRGRGCDPAEAIGTTLGDEVLILAMLRNPVERALAGAQHQLTMGRIEADDDIFEADPKLGIIDLGFYARHVEHWRTILDPQQIRVYLFDDLQTNPPELLRRVLGDLTLDPAAISEAHWALVEKPSNSRKELQARQGKAAKFVASEETRRRLAALYDDDISYVEDLLGRDLASWRSLA